MKLDIKDRGFALAATKGECGGPPADNPMCDHAEFRYETSVE